MSTLDDVVKAMSKEMNNSTLGWDVVVNYTAKEMNELLAAAYKKGQPGQLVEITTQLKVSNPIEPGERYTVDYVFKLGPPLIQFKDSAMVPACQLEIPVTGGLVKVPQKKIEQTIGAGRYRLVISGIALASVNCTEGASRDPKLGCEPFVFNSADTTGAVTLDLDTSASKDWLKVELKGPNDDQYPFIDEELGPLEKNILTFLETPPHSIHWDLARVNNSFPSNGGTQFVPKRFRFAVYSPTASSPYTILSLFIHIDGRVHGGVEDRLQQNWTAKWSKDNYDVPPIPHPYTASVIFNNEVINELVESSLYSKGLKFEEVEKTPGDTWGLKWKILTGKKFEIVESTETRDNILYSIEGASVDLDKEAKALFMTLGQDGGSDAQVNLLLEWEFSFKMEWGITVGGRAGAETWGIVEVTDKVNKKKYVDNDDLPEYKLRLDASLKDDDWEAHYKARNPIGWETFHDGVRWDQKFAQAQPSFNLELFNIDFFLMTNLLLPNQKVIKFKTEPGARMPRDLYLVGHVVHEDRVNAGRAASAALAS
ncbi:hypothetical protein M378DRAFT_952949 [Amanita muscaria Koide BX008]|uniref:Uncharacterized protein n=1 Tax=Amanita muscaria (strain Koide BX008) TaxID=946122 RepID=A0A0C2WFE7_AMAMK|nr:hypothetical protein M378DRAFT_952949 [Amanita muscaria Koide BX008]